MSVTASVAAEERIGVPRLGGAFELVDRRSLACFCLVFITLWGQERQRCD